jgi:carbon monoxide dehydrogenase subunit G
MFKISGSVCIDAPVASVWAVLSDLESIHVWVAPIKRSRCVSAHTRGTGAVRVCELNRSIAVRETIIDWSEGESFTYTGEGAPLMKRALNRWSVEAHGAQTLVTSFAEVELKGGVWGRLLQPLVALVARRMGSRSLAGLKYLVENGKAYSGPPRRLLPAPSIY